MEEAAAIDPGTAEGQSREKAVTIIINGRAFEVDEKEISFEEVVDLRYDNNPPTGENVVITVNYSKGHDGKEGSLQPGHSVKVKAGMIFNVVDSTRS
jgi:hypothetical protein